MAFSMSGIRRQNMQGMVTPSFPPPPSPHLSPPTKDLTSKAVQSELVNSIDGLGILPVVLYQIEIIRRGE